MPAVTELMVAELLYLEKQGQNLPVEMLINSSGTTRQDGEIVSARGALGMSSGTAARGHAAACEHPRCGDMPACGTHANWVAMAELLCMPAS